MTKHIHRALIVEDDDAIAELVQDHLESLDHSYDRAANQAEARSLLASKKYCYVLLDLEIPVKRKRMPEVTHGVNLLESIRRINEACRTQVIIMTSHGSDGPDLAVDMMKKGADDYICKRFDKATSGRTLAGVIKEAIQRGCRHIPSQCAILHGGQPPEAETPVSQQTELKPFQGGKLVFYPSHVELLGCVILTGKGGKFSRPLLDLLAKKTNGKYMTYSGNAIAKELRSPKGQNDVAGYVKHLRKKIRLALKAEGISGGDQDVIMSGGPGYRLNQWIDVDFIND